MYIDDKTIKAVESKYGEPVLRTTRFEMGKREFEGLKGSQKNGRSHDITLYIRKGEEFVVNAKHFYPAGLFRAPSGGIEPGEDLVEGAKREAIEETGSIVELERYILRIGVEFFCEDEAVQWTSHVFLADFISGDLSQRDTREIREVSLASLNDFDHFGEVMRASSIGGFHYRAYLHDQVRELL